MLFFLPHLHLSEVGVHLHLRWGAPLEGLHLQFDNNLHVYCSGPGMDSTVSYHRPTIPPHL